MTSFRAGLVLVSFVLACADGGTTPGNHPPTAAGVRVTTLEDTAITQAFPATDPDGDPLTITLGIPQHGTATTSGMQLTYTPAANYNGDDQFTVMVSDGIDTVSATVDVTVTAVNDAPIGVDDSFATAEDTALVVGASMLLANDTDLEGDTLRVTEVGFATHGTVVPSGTNFTFTPAQDFVGVATFGYTLSDGTTTASAMVTITVGGANDAPIAVDDTATTPEDVALALTSAMLTANDTDIDGQTLTVTAVANPTHGTVTLTGTTITFTPAANFAGAATFEYTITDGSLTDTGSVSIAVTAVDDAPVAVDDSATTTEDIAVALTAATLTANDTDVDGPALAVTAVGNPVNGTVVLSGTTATFTPASNFSGAASFEYTVSDGTLTDVGTVAVAVTPVNDAPIAVDDAASAQTNVATLIAKATLLANDTDVDGPALSITAVQNPVNCTVTLGASAISFKSTTGFTGTATFEYVVSDGSATDVGVVTVTVQAGAVCGDGTIAAPEVCDDGNTTTDDGCNAMCAVETGWTCAGAPSSCTPTCGDSMTVGSEECDDGNPSNLDGCTTSCVRGRLCTVGAFPGGDRFAVDPATGHCFVSYDTEQTTFGAAYDLCNAAGGYLATITSAAEDTVARSVQNASQNPWIGGSDDANDTDAIFAWVTGEPFAYQHFAQGQPDDDAGIDGMGECLHFSNDAGEWSDTNCNITSFVVGRICESDPFVTFSFTGSLGNEVSLPADAAVSGLTVVPAMTRGAGVSPQSTPNAINSSGWNSAIPGAIDLADYYTFTVTPTSGTTLSLYRLELDERRSLSGLRTWSVRSSLDAFAADLKVFDVPDDDLIRVNQFVVLGTAFARVATPVEFRIYGYGAEAGAGTWRLDNVELFGRVSVP